MNPTDSVVRQIQQLAKDTRISNGDKLFHMERVLAEAAVWILYLEKKVRDRIKANEV